MKSFSFTFLSIIFLLYTGYLTNAQERSIEEALLSLDDYIENAMNDWQVPGLAIGIVKDSNVVFTKGYGHRDLESKLPVNENTLFAIGSCTKAFTSVCFGQLVDNKKANLDKPVINYLPNFELSDEYITKNVTARDLMSHRSGLPRHDLVWFGTDLNREKLFKSLKHLEFTKGLREQFQYNNLFYMTVGYMVGHISNQTWEQYTKKNILLPLEMTTSNFSVEQMSETNNFSYPYGLEDDKIKRIPFRNIDAIGPAGSINSSVKEMSNWLIMNLNKGKFNGKQIISNTYLKQAFSQQITTPLNNNIPEVMLPGYGLGWSSHSFRGYLRIAHGGGIDGFTSFVTLFPKESLGIVILTNSNTPISRILANVIAEKLLGTEEKDWHKESFEKYSEQKYKTPNAPKNLPIEGTSPTHELKAYVGDYNHPAYGTIHISLSDSGLVASRKPFETFLEHYHYDVFKATQKELTGRRMQFHYNLNGKIEKLTMRMEWAVPAIEFKKVPKTK